MSTVTNKPRISTRAIDVRCCYNCGPCIDCPQNVNLRLDLQHIFSPSYENYEKISHRWSQYSLRQPDLKAVQFSETSAADSVTRRTRKPTASGKLSQSLGPGCLVEFLDVFLRRTEKDWRRSNRDLAGLGAGALWNRKPKPAVENLNDESTRSDCSFDCERNRHADRTGSKQHHIGFQCLFRNSIPVVSTATVQRSMSSVNVH